MRLMSLVLLIFVLSGPGCVRVATVLQPDDLTVQNELHGEDCVPFYLTLDTTAVSIEAAKRQATADPAARAGTDQIGKVRRIETSTEAGFGLLVPNVYCIRVYGARAAPD